ncbi:MAG: alpha/beta hydrolase [Anaerolineae bacterium]|nr:alpha/beta hydrolase [Anaerolineae bacterium]
MMSTHVATRGNTESSRTTQQKRGCLFTVGRVLKWFAIFLVALIVLGIGYQTVATELDKGKYSPRGQFYTVNGHQMHMICMGEGSPAVILEAGATAESLWWYRIQQQLAAHTQVCAYDRAGLGWSEVAEGPRDPLTIAADLHKLLQEAGVAGPYVVAGHSFGAVWARIFATQYPQEVSGVVLVDSTVIPRRDDYPSWKTFNDIVQAALWLMSRTGVLRLTVANQFEVSGYPRDVALELSARQALNQTFDTSYAETIAAMTAFIDSAASSENLGDLPLMVLWAGAGPMSSDQQAEIRAQTAGYSSNSATQMIEGADHGSILGNEAYAQQVTDAILDVIAAAETGQPLAQ